MPSSKPWGTVMVPVQCVARSYFCSSVDTWQVSLSLKGRLASWYCWNWARVGSADMLKLAPALMLALGQKYTLAEGLVTASPSGSAVLHAKAGELSLNRWN